MTIEKLHHFVSAVGTFVSGHYGGADDEARLIPQVSDALKQLVSSDDWLPAAYARPSRERYQQYLLYLDPQARFSVVSFVWGPGQRTPVHNHTVWGVIGVLRGAEKSVAYRIEDGIESGSGTEGGRPVATGAETVLLRGAVEAVSPTIGDIHEVSNLYSDSVSVSIHVYGADIGKVRRSVFPFDAPEKAFVSGYADLPALIDAV
jgi:predicted metal-dependent enzyme (double-stranded beta helix superfamily)